MKGKLIACGLILGCLMFANLPGCFPEPEDIIETQDKALLVILENNATIPSQIKQLGDVLGGLDIAGYTDYYGEEAVETTLRLIAAPYYDLVIVLSDAQVSFKNIKDTLEFLDNNDYRIDIISDVHGGKSKGSYYLYLYEDQTNQAPADPLDDHRLYPEEIEQLGFFANINAVYQVSCYGGAMLDAWLQVGAKVVNGARDVNYYVILSPIAFLEEWVAGASFKSAVSKAYQAEQYILEDIVSQQLGESWMDLMFFSNGECDTDTQGNPVCSCAEASQMILAGDEMTTF